MSDVIFLAALHNTDRKACALYIKNNTSSRDSSDIERTRNAYRSLKWLSDPNLQALSLQVLTASLGAPITLDTKFPATVWYGGMTGSYNGHRFTGTFQDFIVHILETRSKAVAEKGTGWVVTPTTNTDGHRTNESTTEMHALNLDCDGLGSWNKLLDILNKIGIAYAAYQSGGWTETAQKWHITIPLSKPFNTSTPTKIELWKRAYCNARVVFGSLADLTGEGFDPTVDTPSQPVFITERRNVNDSPRKIVWKTGKSLDLVALTVALPEPEQENRGTYEPEKVEQRVLGNAELERIVSTICVPMSKIMGGRRDLYLGLPGALLDKGVAPDDVLTIIEEISLRCPGDPSYTNAEVASKHKEHVHCAQTTIKKWEKDEPYYRVGLVLDNSLEVVNAINEALPDQTIESLRSWLSPVTKTETVTANIYQSSVSVDLSGLRKLLIPVKRRKLKSKKLDELIKGVLLGRLIDGDVLVDPSDGDQLTCTDGKKMTRELAISKVMGLLAYKFPANTPLEAIAEIVRPSINAMCEDGEIPSILMKYAENSYLQALSSRKTKDEKRRTEELKRLENLSNQLDSDDY